MQTKMNLKQAVEINLNYIKCVARFVFYALLFMVTLTATEAVFYPLSRRRYEMVELGLDGLNYFRDYSCYNQVAKFAEVSILQGCTYCRPNPSCCYYWCDCNDSHLLSCDLDAS